MSLNRPSESSRLKPMAAYDGGTGTYRSTPHPPEITAEIEKERQAFASRQLTRQVGRSTKWQARLHKGSTDRDQEVKDWNQEAQTQRHRLSDVLGLQATDPPAYHIQIKIETAGGTHSGTQLILQSGIAIRMLNPATEPGAPIRLLPAGARLEDEQQTDPSAWVVELPSLLWSDDRLGKALLLRGRPLAGIACEQLYHVVTFLVGRPQSGGEPPHLLGNGFSGWVALLHTALDTRIGSVAAAVDEDFLAEWPSYAAIPRFSLDFDVETLAHLVAPRPFRLNMANVTHEWPAVERATTDCQDEVTTRSLYPPVSVPYLQAAHTLLGVEGDCTVEDSRGSLSTHSRTGQKGLRLKSGSYDPQAKRLFERKRSPEPKHIDQLASREEWRLWREKLQSDLTQSIGPLRPTRPPLSVRTRALAPIGETRVEEITFNSEENIRHRGIILTPSWKPGPYPVVLCLPGSSQRPEDLMNSWGAMVADAGYAAWIVDVKPARLRPNISREITEGRAMVWNMALDLMAAVDWVETRSDLASERIAAMGVSIGGTQAWMLAALDQRVKVSIPVVGVTSYDALIRDTLPSGRSFLNSHSWYYYYPILTLAEQYDLVGLIAPRPLAILGMSEDNCFPVEGVREANQKVASLYRLLEMPQNFHESIAEGPHSFPTELRQKALEWLDCHL